MLTQYSRVTLRYVSQKWGGLQDSCNRFGDYNLAYAKKLEDGSSIWSERHSVMELWHLNLTDHVPLYKKTSVPVWKFIELANNRSIHEAELILDLEAPERYEEVKDKLLSRGLEFEAYLTGSRGYHFNAIFRDFPLMSVSRRQQVRKQFIEYFGCDVLKSSDKTMIALEGAPHWKTGIHKRLEYTNEGDKDE
ncbi:hypothetical protein HYY74_01115 [Candidatus Woesearchaeota archaeon]|nr:hypothetical protein [Candidatus Woesearchaeota archaeon]